MNLWIPLSIATLSLAFFLLLGRRDERRVKREWDDLHHAGQAALVSWIQKHLATGMDMVDFHYETARRLQQLRNVDDAKHLLSAGYRALELLVPNLRMLLTVMTRFTRMVTAITPLDAIDPKDFQDRPAAGLAHLHRWVQQLTGTVRESFRLRLFVLHCGIRLTSRRMGIATRRIIDEKELCGNDERHWNLIAILRHDFRVIIRETVSSFRWMLAAVSADVYSQLGSAATPRRFQLGIDQGLGS